MNAFTNILLGFTLATGAAAADNKRINLRGEDPAANRAKVRSTYGIQKNPPRSANRADVIEELGGSAETEKAVRDHLLSRPKPYGVLSLPAHAAWLPTTQPAPRARQQRLWHPRPAHTFHPH